MTSRLTTERDYRAAPTVRKLSNFGSETWTRTRVWRFRAACAAGCTISELGWQERTRTSIPLSNSQVSCRLDDLPANLVAAAGVEPAQTPGFNRTLYLLELHSHT